MEELILSSSELLRMHTVETVVRIAYFLGRSLTKYNLSQLKVFYDPFSASSFLSLDGIITYNTSDPRVVIEESAHFLHHKENPNLLANMLITELLYFDILTEAFAHFFVLQFDGGDGERDKSSLESLIEVADYMVKCNTKPYTNNLTAGDNAFFEQLRKFTVYGEDGGTFEEWKKRMRTRYNTQNSAGIPIYEQWTRIKIALNYARELCAFLISRTNSPYSIETKLKMMNFASQIWILKQGYETEEVTPSTEVVHGIGYNLGSQLASCFKTRPDFVKQLLKNILTVTPDTVIRVMYDTYTSTLPTMKKDRD